VMFTTFMILIFAVAIVGYTKVICMIPDTPLNIYEKFSFGLGSRDLRNLYKNYEKR
jgi:hypothetical protein